VGNFDEHTWGTSVSAITSHVRIEGGARRGPRRFDVVFDDAVPAWQRRQKLEGWGRTYWRLALNP
jgi:hypothetical protein